MKPSRKFSKVASVTMIVLAMTTLASCINPMSIWFPPDVEYFAENTTTASWYVDNATGNDANPGTKDKPLRTIQVAANRIRSKFRDDAINAFRIYVSSGTYTPGNGLVSEGEYGLYIGIEHFSLPPPPITLSFGWDAAFAVQADDNPTVFDTQGLLAQPYYFHTNEFMNVTIEGTILPSP